MKNKFYFYLITFLLISISISARSFRVSQLPNGAVASCQTCHVSPSGGDERNAFGKLIEKRFLTANNASGNVIWGPELASLDADGDGITNGEELQDPFGLWTSGSSGISGAVSNPGLSADIPLVSLTVNFSNMTPHVGQTLFIRVVDKATLKEVVRNTETISADFNLILDFALIPGKSYIVDFFADHNGNGKYDIPPADHAWRMEIDAAASNNQLSFSHNTDFTDIKWPSIFDLNLMSMTPHLNQLLELALIQADNNDEIDRVRIESISSADFSVRFSGLEDGKNYKVIFYSDHNGNGIYDAPPADHAWELNFTYTEGLSENFTHNTNFTNIDWKYSAALNLVNMNPHVNQLFEIRVVDKNSDLEVSRFNLDAILSNNFSVELPGIEIGKTYNLDFYSDHNGNKSYDAPPVDHAWRIEFTASGNYISNFSHNTSFTDIQWPGATSVDDLTIPREFNLAQNYPNPFNPATKIQFSIPSNQNVNIAVYDVLGNKVAELINEFKSAGTYSVNFDASSLSSGIYLYRIISNNFVQTNKMMLVK